MRLLTTLLFLSATKTVHSWGELGHRTVAYLAQKRLTPAAQNLVDGLLADDQALDISDAAVWADSVRKTPGYYHTGGWHFIDAEDDPPRTCNVNYTRDCNPQPGCIISAITNMTFRLSNPNLSIANQNEALKFIIHFLGDIHQPLHTEHLSFGGNLIHVCFDGRCDAKMNLHSTWDKEIPHKYRGLPPVDRGDPVLKAEAKKWADELSDSTSTDRDVGCTDITNPQTCALEWANEANSYICSYVLHPGVQWVKDNDLGGKYYEGAFPVIETLITKGGLRLAAWLNAVAEKRADRGGVGEGAQEVIEL
ncbi:S1/P1 nuclease [Delitschia confertaspora ATCC 74209]|uniref:S1/P1 nuclease n=1 Tax=Delitschia confertaspora ATCC 74209 TaxID=1513339 RepID=A0A9P4MN84_9PLEO|nr:S1/P1 nuclease [Delitschia confertaspora ATCC 74209]